MTKLLDGFTPEMDMAELVDGPRLPSGPDDLVMEAASSVEHRGTCQIGADAGAPTAAKPPLAVFLCSSREKARGCAIATLPWVWHRLHWFVDTRGRGLLRYGP